MSTKTKSLYDPKSEILKNLLTWESIKHVKDWHVWEANIEEALAASSDNQLEQDNFKLQGENQLNLSIIAEQEVKIKRLEMSLESYRNFRKTTMDKYDELSRFRVDDGTRGYY